MQNRAKGRIPRRLLDTLATNRPTSNDVGRAVLLHADGRFHGNLAVGTNWFDAILSLFVRWASLKLKTERILPKDRGEVAERLNAAVC
jgi:hypothetical protein